MDRIRVLIADDTKETVDLVRKVLNIEQDKFEIVGEASNGEEALELIPTANPDIVLMDINMPVMNGLEATEKITSEFPTVAVVIMSVQGENEYLRKAMLCGAKEYIVKPFNYNTLLETIRNTYDKNKELLEIELHQQQAVEAQEDEEDHQYDDEGEDVEDIWEDDELQSSTCDFSEKPIQDSLPKKLNIKPGFRATCLALPHGGVSRLVQTGQSVDVVVYLEQQVGENSNKGFSLTILENCRVLDVDKGSDEVYVTLVVSAQEVEKVVLAENSGKIKLVIRANNDQSKKKRESFSWESLEIRSITQT